MKESFDEIYKCLTVVLTVFSGGIGIYAIAKRIKSEFLVQMVTLIQSLEGDYNLTGPEKMDMLIEYVRNAIPRLFTIVFSDEVLRAIAQSIYNDMKKYADNHIKVKTGYGTEDVTNLVKEVEKQKMIYKDPYVSDWDGDAEKKVTRIRSFDKSGKEFVLYPVEGREQDGGD